MQQQTAPVGWWGWYPPFRIYAAAARLERKGGYPVPNYAAAAGLESQGGYPVNRQVPGVISFACLQS